MRTLAALRNEAVRQAIADRIAAYLKGARQRPCAYCGRRLKARSRYHNFCPPEGAEKRSACRAAFYGGIFVPRPRD